MNKIKFDSTQGLVKISALVSGPKKKNYLVILAIDTGSYLSTLSPEVLAKIGLSESTEDVLLIGVSESVRVKLVTVDAVTVAGISVNNYKVASHNLSAVYDIDGLLGKRALSYFLERRNRHIAAAGRGWLVSSNTHRVTP